MDKTIAILATMDTKGEEAKYLKAQIEKSAIAKNRRMLQLILMMKFMC